MFVALTLFAGALVAQETASPAVLSEGEVHRGRIGEASSSFLTERLQTELAAMLPAKSESVAFVPAQDGDFVFELRSLDFYSSLAVLGPSGVVLAEEAKNPFRSFVRIGVAGLRSGTTYRVHAWALQDGAGAFELRVRPGTLPSLSQAELARSDLEDAQEQVARLLREAVEGARLATAHEYVGMNLVRLGRFADAEQPFEQALEIRQRVLGEDDVLTNQSVNMLAVVAFRQGKDREARLHFERVLESYVERLGSDSLPVAAVRNNLASVLRQLGEYPESIAQHRQALAVRESKLPPEHPLVAQSVRNLGNALRFVGEFEEARTLFERAVRIREATLPPEHSQIGAALQSLGAVHHRLGQFELAESILRRSVAIHEASSGADHPETAYALSALADALLGQGRTEEARPLKERALQIREDRLGPDHRLTASSLADLAGLYVALEKVEEAEPLLRRALAVHEAALGPDHASVADVLESLAFLLLRNNQEEEAARHASRALAIRSEAFGPDHLRTIFTLPVVADTLAVTDPHASLAMHERALRALEAALPPGHPRIARAQSRLGWSLANVGRTEEAVPHLERALESQRALLGDASAAVAERRRFLAILHLRLGEPRRAWEYALASVESMERRLGPLLAVLTESERFRYLAGHRRALDLALRLAPLTGDPAHEEAIFARLLVWKGRASRVLLESRKRLLADLGEAERVLLDELRAVSAQLSSRAFDDDLAHATSGVDALDELRRRREALERALLEADADRASAESLASEGEAPVAAPALPSLADLRRSLPADAALVVYFFHPPLVENDEGNPRSLDLARGDRDALTAWVLEPGAALRRLELGPAKEVERSLVALRPLLAAERGGEALQGRKPGVAPRELRALLWDPIAPFLTRERIFVSPDGALAGLPLEVLPEDDGTYLVERHAFVYAQDALSSAGGTNAPRGRDALLVGAVDYDVAEAEHAKTEHADTEERAAPLAPPLRGGRRSDWPSLSGTATEIDAIYASHAAAFGDGARRVSLRGSAATEDRLKSRMGEFSTLHLATHGSFLPSDLPSAWARVQQLTAGRPLDDRWAASVSGHHPGLLSALVLAGANHDAESAREDGYLTAEEVSWLDLTRVDLVVLSACETSLGQSESGEGMLGLRRAFRVAGARTIISSLWAVGDAETSDLMTRFYENLWERDLGALEALRQAQLELLAENRRAHGQARPGTWGAFVLSGDWR